MIGTKWYYVDTPSTIKAATVIAETPRKWILRDDDADSEWLKNVAPGDAIYDRSIFKSGDGDARESRDFRGKSARTFFATEAAALRRLAKIQAENWRCKHAYAISKAVEQIKDPALLAQVADLIGYPKDGQ